MASKVTVKLQTMHLCNRRMFELCVVSRTFHEQESNPYPPDFNNHTHNAST